MVALFIINDSPLTYNSFVGIEGLSHRKTLTTQCIWCIIIRLAAVAELADARDLKSLDRKVVRVQSPLWAPKQNERVTIQIHTRLPFKISPFTLVVAIANANRRGFFFFPPSFLSPPPSAPQPLRTRRHVFLHILWAGSAYFPWGVGGASRASGGHPGSLSISAG